MSAVVASLIYSLEMIGFAQIKHWEVTNDALGRCKVLQGLYLNCDSGYHRWPCFAYPVKVGNPRTVSMKFSKLVESVQKDIEGVFGILLTHPRPHAPEQLTLSFPHVIPPSYHRRFSFLRKRPPPCMTVWTTDWIICILCFLDRDIVYGDSIASINARNRMLPL